MKAALADRAEDRAARAAAEMEGAAGRGVAQVAPEVGARADWEHPDHWAAPEVAAKEVSADRAVEQAGRAAADSGSKGLPQERAWPRVSEDGLSIS